MHFLVNSKLVNTWSLDSLTQRLGLVFIYFSNPLLTVRWSHNFPTFSNKAAVNPAGPGSVPSYPLRINSSKCNCWVKSHGHSSSNVGTVTKAGSPESYWSDGQTSGQSWVPQRPRKALTQSQWPKGLPPQGPLPTAPSRLWGVCTGHSPPTPAGSWPSQKPEPPGLDAKAPVTSERPPAPKTLPGAPTLRPRPPARWGPSRTEPQEGLGAGYTDASRTQHPTTGAPRGQRESASPCNTQTHNTTPHSHATHTPHTHLTGESAGYKEIPASLMPLHTHSHATHTHPHTDIHTSNTRSCNTHPTHKHTHILKEKVLQHFLWEKNFSSPDLC